MKTAACVLAALLIGSGAAMAQDVNEPTPQQNAPAAAANTLDKTLIANERKVVDAIAKGDKAAFQSLVTPTAQSADGRGFGKVSDFIAMLDQVKVASWTMSEEKVTWVDPTTAIVTYKLTAAGTVQGQPMPSTVYSSSVWTKKGDKWLAVFHHESEAAKK